MSQAFDEEGIKDAIQTPLLADGRTDVSDRTVLC